MSLDVTKACWKNSQHSGTKLLMLVAIADFSDDSGKAFPSVRTLATKCRMCHRNAQYIIKELVKSGELSVEPNRGPSPKFSNLYKINLNQLGVQPISRVKHLALVQSDVCRDAIHRTKDMQPTASKQSITVNNNQTHYFEEFWTAYPNCTRKGSKSKCFKVWQSKKLDFDANQIIAHVEAMTASDDWIKNNGTFIPAPLAYLNQQRWDGAEVTSQDPMYGVNF